MGISERIQIIEEIESILNNNKDNIDLPENHKDSVKILFSDSSVINLCRNVLNREFMDKLNYEQLKEISQTLSSVSNKLNDISNNIDIELFLKGGYRLDYDGLVNKFNELGLSKLFPNIDLKKLTSFYEKPFRFLKAKYDNNLKINYNAVVVRKFIIAILQMVFNEMDLLSVYTGSEGAGKSTLCTQHIYLMYYILTECNIINYPYKIKNMMFSSLSTLRQAEDEMFSEKFRLIALDEGNELHRQNWKEEEVQVFFQRLRRERFNQRIKFICIPVLGELMTNIIMSRVNFIFEVYSSNMNKLGILEKGKGKMYIIPRGNVIYSYEHKKELSVDKIKASLYDNLKDKTYLKGMPSELVIQKFQFNGTNGFPKDEYIKELKLTNKSFTTKSGIRIADTTLYILYRLNLLPKKIGLKTSSPEYASYHKFLQHIRTYFIDNPRVFKNEEEKFKAKHLHS